MENLQFIQVIIWSSPLSTDESRSTSIWKFNFYFLHSEEEKKLWSHVCSPEGELIDVFLYLASYTPPPPPFPLPAFPRTRHLLSIATGGAVNSTLLGR